MRYRETPSRHTIHENYIQCKNTVGSNEVYMLRMKTFHLRLFIDIARVCMSIWRFVTKYEHDTVKSWCNQSSVDRQYTYHDSLGVGVDMCHCHHNTLLIFYLSTCGSECFNLGQIWTHGVIC